MKINRKVWHINYGIPDKTGNMQNINSSTFITKKLKQLPLLGI